MPADFLVTLPTLLQTLFAPGLDPVTFRARAATLLREAVSCQIVSFATLDPATRRLDLEFDPYFPALDRALAGFGRHMAKYPCFNFDPTVAGGLAFLRGDFLSDADFLASDIYREGFALAGISDHAAVLLSSTDHSICFIGLELTGGTFQPWQRDRLRTLQPHLANARQLAQALASLEQAVADPAAFRRAGLTRRESEVLSHLARGHSNAEIAALLHLRLPTVKGYVATVFDKLGVDNRHAALLRAHQLARSSGRPAASTTTHASTRAAPTQAP